MPAAPREVWAPLASEAPLGKMESVERRGRQVKKGVQGQLVPGVIPGLLGSRGPPDREKTESRGSVGHLDHLGL